MSVEQRHTMLLSWAKSPLADLRQVDTNIAMLPAMEHVQTI